MKPEDIDLATLTGVQLLALIRALNDFFIGEVRDQRSDVREHITDDYVVSASVGFCSFPIASVITESADFTASFCFRGLPFVSR
jgi:hypothetical protein